MLLVSERTSRLPACFYVFNYLFTLKNVHLSSNSYNFWMQPNISMKSAGYVAWILLCKHCNFGKKKLLQFQRYQNFLGGYFFSHTLHTAYIALLIVHYLHSGTGKCFVFRTEVAWRVWFQHNADRWSCWKWKKYSVIGTYLVVSSTAAMLHR